MVTPSSVETTAPADLDLLQQIAVSVPCASCGQQHNITLRDVLMSQDMLHEGCPVYHETECLPRTYAPLADEAALRDFEQSWSRLLHKVQAAGFELNVCRPFSATDRGMIITETAVREALRRVIDPELGINIVELGLV